MTRSSAAVDRRHQRILERLARRVAGDYLDVADFLVIAEAVLDIPDR